MAPRLFAHNGSYYALWAFAAAVLTAIICWISVGILDGQATWRDLRQSCIARGGQLVDINDKVYCGEMRMEFTPR